MATASARFAAPIFWKIFVMCSRTPLGVSCNCLPISASVSPRVMTEGSPAAVRSAPASSACAIPSAVPNEVRTRTLVSGQDFRISAVAVAPSAVDPSRRPDEIAGRDDQVKPPHVPLRRPRELRYDDRRALSDAKTPNEIAPKRRTKSRQNAERLTTLR